MGERLRWSILTAEERFVQNQPGTGTKQNEFAIPNLQCAKAIQNVT